MSDQQSFMLEDAQIIFRNFSGAEGPYNRPGDRNFSVVVPEENVEQMLSDGWNVKRLAPREEGDTPTAYISVVVSYKARPPRVVLITSRARQNLIESEVEVLDWADIKSADLIANAYNWNVGGKSGVKAYLKSLFVTIEEDALEIKYAEITSNE